MHNGVDIAMYQPPDLDDLWPMLRELRRKGATAVAFNIPWYVYVPRGSSTIAKPPKEWGGSWGWIYPDERQDPEHPFGNYTPPSLLRACCLLALAAGFERVMIKFLLDSHNAYWRGFISVGEHAGEFGWASSYLPLVHVLPPAGSGRFLEAQPTTPLAWYPAFPYCPAGGSTQSLILSVPRSLG